MSGRIVPSSVRPLIGGMTSSRLSGIASVALAIAAVIPVETPAQSAVTLRAADSALAATAAHGLRAALAAGMADDAVLLYPGAPIVRGRAAAVHLLDSLPDVAEHVTWRPVRAEVSADGTRGYSYGRGVIGRDSASGPSGMHYIAWWRRDGERWVVAAWLLQRTRATPPDTLPTWPCEAIAVVSPASAHAESPASVLAADAAFAARADSAGPAVAFAAYAADDGVSLGARPVPACGKAQIGAQFEGSGPGDLRWAPSVGDAAASGDLGYTVGSATVRGQTGTFHSKYITVWKRQADGSWRFVADGGNAMPAVPSAAR